MWPEEDIPARNERAIPDAAPTRRHAATVKWRPRRWRGQLPGPAAGIEACEQRQTCSRLAVLIEGKDGRLYGTTLNGLLGSERTKLIVLNFIGKVTDDGAVGFDPPKQKRTRDAPKLVEFLVVTLLLNWLAELLVEGSEAIADARAAGPVADPGRLERRAVVASGEGIGHAVQRTGYADFWTLRRLNVLPKETANYVPAILAMTIMSKRSLMARGSIECCQETSSYSIWLSRAWAMI